MYILRFEGEELLLGLFVDDIIGASSSMKLRTKFIADLSKEFNVDDRGDLVWALGLRVARDRAKRTVTLSCEARRWLRNTA